MLKKKKKKHWSKKKIDNKLLFGFILIILLLSIIVAFGTYFQVISWNNISQNFITFSIPTPTLKPDYIPPPIIVPTSVIPPVAISEMPDELVVSRAISLNPFQNHNYSLTPVKTINEPSTVQKFYRAVLSLPPIPTGTANEGHCVLHPYLVRYDLTFDKNNKLIHHGTLDILVGCGTGETVSLDGSYARQFYTFDKVTYGTFASLLEKTFGLTGSQLYEMPDTNWLRVRGVPEKPY